MTSSKDLTEATPLATEVFKTTSDIFARSQQMLDNAKRHDRLGRYVMDNKITGCDIRISVKGLTAPIITNIPKDMQMRFVREILEHYRLNVLDIYEDIKKLSEDL